MGDRRLPGAGRSRAAEDLLPEVVDAVGHQLHLGRRPGRRGSGEPQQRAELAEVVVRSERRQVLDATVGQLALDAHGAGPDDVDELAPRSLLDDDRPGPEVLEVGRLLVLAEVGHERSEEHTSALQSLMRSSYAVFCVKKTTPNTS